MAKPALYEQYAGYDSATGLIPCKIVDLQTFPEATGSVDQTAGVVLLPVFAISHQPNESEVSSTQHGYPESISRAHNEINKC